MAEFTHQDMHGSRFQTVQLDDSRFREVSLRGSDFRGVDLCRTRMRGVLLEDVEINGEIRNLRINGVDVGPLIEAELDRRDPDRVRMRPTDAAGFRAAWDVMERRWAETVDRARRLAPDQLHQSVGDEWSFIQTLRHLVYATDVWVNRVILGDPRPFHPLSLPFDEADPHPEVPWDRDARPSLDEVLAIRADRMAMVRRVLDRLTDEQLDSKTTPVEGPGWPPADAYPVREALLTVLNEEWHHRVFAERDLSVIESGGVDA